MRERLFIHAPHPHTPRNANRIHEAEQAIAGINQRLAVLLTRIVGTMPCAYIFALIALIGFPGLLGSQVSIYVQWASQTLIQLTMLSILMVGQSVLARKQEIQADAQFADVEKTFHDIEQVMQHLSAQDDELLRQSQSLERLTAATEKLIKRIDAATGRGAA